MGPYKEGGREVDKYSLGTQQVKYLELQNFRGEMHKWIDELVDNIVKNECPCIKMTPLYETEKLNGWLANQMRLYEEENGIVLSATAFATMPPEELTTFLGRKNIGRKSIGQLRDVLRKYGLNMERIRGKSGRKQWAIVD